MAIAAAAKVPSNVGIDLLLAMNPTSSASTGKYGWRDSSEPGLIIGMVSLLRNLSPFLQDVYGAMARIHALEMSVFQGNGRARHRPGKRISEMSLISG